MLAMTAEHRAVAVGLGELRVSRDPAEILVAYGLGSCVAVGVYDPHNRASGLLHAVLPRHLNGEDALAPKYVDSGVTALLRELKVKPAEHARLVVWLVGGANMLASTPSLARTLDIGDRNIAVAQEMVSKFGLKVRGQDLGGNTGRTVRLYVAEGRLTMRVIGQTEREL